MEYGLRQIHTQLKKNAYPQMVPPRNARGYIQKKHPQGHVVNAVMASVWAQPMLPPDEVVIVEVFNKQQTMGLPFTETGCFAPGYGFIRYAEVLEVHWISRDGKDIVEMKQTHSDRLVLALRNRPDLIIEGLGPAFLPVMRFLEWVIKKRAHTEGHP